MLELPYPTDIAVELILGALLIVFGRRLFWLCLGSLGFLLAFSLVSSFSLDISPQWVLVVALVLGAVGAMVAIFLQKIAVGVGGLLFGGFATMWLLDTYQPDVRGLEWLVIAGVALVAALVSLKLFEVALVVLSSMAGASILVRSSGLEEEAAAVLFVVLVIIGIAVQTRHRRRAKSAEKSD